VDAVKLLPGPGRAITALFSCNASTKQIHWQYPNGDSPFAAFSTVQAAGQQRLSHSQREVLRRKITVYHKTPFCQQIYFGIEWLYPSWALPL
jgi:hypothetical protein